MDTEPSYMPAASRKGCSGWESRLITPLGTGNTNLAQILHSIEAQIVHTESIKEERERESIRDCVHTHFLSLSVIYSSHHTG